MPITINGTGTITGISVGGLPDATVTPADLSQPFTSGTAVASTSGTSIDFTGIPSWVKRVTVMFNSVSTNGTSNLLIRLRTSGSFVTTGYVSQAMRYYSSATTASVTTGFGVWIGYVAGDSSKGSVSLCLQNSSLNSWVSTGLLVDASNVNMSSGNISLAGVLDGIRITTANGTDTFDAGSINILYE
jgi:hypothetical protein